MAKVVKKKAPIRPGKKTYTSPFGIYWQKLNYQLLFIGIIALIVGYYVMSIGNWDSTASLVLSPIILVIAYVLIFPAAIFFKKKGEKQEEPKPEA